ncbi:hypothetical protein LUX12_07635 [Streptomyces somaliensis]|uniref:hypothetical protein n=1 Tax=Streptomyces somaliensis TaxID=78355 RepID=UPI0020CDFA11|nr:hypothetical protein [Streptomyces somaliensis]MCP9944679.1 hypothetical protein [Streptomyces somaliensis]MCP9962100.1 hypothetical protein [Streptomyces somaliensis]MCP9974914.1 hypothetical protein [Streptomyces somaliensis]
MFVRKKVVQNEVVAASMRRTFRKLKQYQRAGAMEAVVTEYARSLWLNHTISLNPVKRLFTSASPFHVSIATADASLDWLTKRVTLISDTLLLSHNGAGKYHKLGFECEEDRWGPPELYSLPMHEIKQGFKQYGFLCPDLYSLGKWLVEAEQLLKSGLAWYMPSYVVIKGDTHSEVREAPERDHLYKYNRYHRSNLDFLVNSRKAVDVSPVQPLKSQLVRPILEIELPFIEGVSLQDFSNITVDEFVSYSAFRDFLRMSFLQMDDSLNAVQSERELLKLGLDIKDQVRAARNQMLQARKKRAVGVTGAAIGSVGAVLVAAYGPALQTAIATLGASGGVWGIIHAMAENSMRPLREDKWYYVWVLAEKSKRSSM